MVLSDLEIAIVATKSMRFTQEESMAYLKDQGHDIKIRTYYRKLGHISSETRKRAFEIAKSFLEDHINTIDELENIKKLMYEKALQEADCYKSTMILAKIVETMIPYISAYKEATKAIIEKVKKEIGKKESNINLSTIGV